MSLLEIAKEYRSAGFNVIPCKNSRPLLKTWSEYQETLVADDDLVNMFSSGSADQIAVICGKISGGLEVIDVDLKFDPGQTVWGPFWNDLIEYFKGEVPLVVANTKSAGVHLYYRCEKIEGNQKLARLIKGGEAVIETRGEGGYVIAPPSPGYTFADTRISLSDVRSITPGQRDDIIDICRKYNKVFVEAKKKSSTVQASAYRNTPWDAYNNDPDEPWAVVMADAGWKESHVDQQGRIHYQRPGSENKYGANWDPEKRLLYVFTPNGGFESEKAYSPSAIYAFLKCGGDFSQAIKEIRAAGYGELFNEKEDRYISKIRNLIDRDIPSIDAIDRVLMEWINESTDLLDLNKEERQKKATEQLTPLAQAAENRLISSKGLFWKTEKKKVVIATDGLVTFLRSQGFKLFVQERDSMLYRVVKVDEESRVISEIPEDAIMKWVEQWVKDNIDDYDVSRSHLLSAVMDFSGWGHYLKWMPRLSLADVSFLRDTKSSAYLPFANGVIHITRSDIQLMPYSSLPKGMLVWRNQIKPETIEIMGIEDGNDLALNETPVFRFFKRICGIMPEMEKLSFAELQTELPENFKRLISLLTILGYTMSNYKDPGTPYAVILAEDTASDKKGGGAGKDLLMKCVKKIRGVSFLPGKLWKPTGNFAFQTYKLGDDVLYIGDPPKFFDFELLYNTISEGLTVEKKNKDALTIPYELSPKVVLSTNYMIDDISEHASRRQVKVLLTKYYNKTLRVEDELGGQFWSDEWTHRDWMMFYLLMFTCIQLFLDQGVISNESTENSKEKSVKQNYGDDFYGFMTEWIKENSGKFVDYLETYQHFLDESHNTDKTYKSNRFAYALDFYANTYGFVLTERRKKNEVGKYRKFFIFTKPNQSIPEIISNTPF